MTLALAQQVEEVPGLSKLERYTQEQCQVHVHAHVQHVHVHILYIHTAICMQVNMMPESYVGQKCSPRGETPEVLMVLRLL